MYDTSRTPLLGNIIMKVKAFSLEHTGTVKLPRLYSFGTNCPASSQYLPSC